ncbi:MAG: hypothetical protein AAFQ22_07175 [Pseudomonadota bacterium]
MPQNEIKTPAPKRGRASKTAAGSQTQQAPPKPAPRRQEPPAHSPGAWPAWRYGPNGEAQIFQGPDEVPEGWADTPAAFK